ncbi:hypothetical protein ACPV3W_18485 [Vibrio parahaemolyticus]|uniref:hypothetical protein n=1 Tax=Vibrio parahaemolyticus TaxID=670 RepID=UPI001E1998E8|nr:hypothetical protein [Vibrio parahaemolyticus]
MKLINYFFALSIVGAVGCTNTTQLDKYNHTKKQMGEACGFAPDDEAVKACNSVKPAKPKTSKYIYHDKANIIASCKRNIENDVQSKARGLQLAVNFGEISEDYALSVVKVITDKARGELKECEKVSDDKSRSIRTEWLKYETALSKYESDSAICLSSKEKVEENASQCESLKSKLQETPKGSVTWHYITKIHEKEAFNNAVWKTAASPIAIPIAIGIDAVNMISD